MQSSQHADRCNGRASELGRDVLGDSGKPKNIDVQNFSGSSNQFQILAAVIPETEVKIFRDVD